MSEHDILWCATEMNTKASMDQVIEIVGEVLGEMKLIFEKKLPGGRTIDLWPCDVPELVPDVPMRREAPRLLRFLKMKWAVIIQPLRKEPMALMMDFIL